MAMNGKPGAKRLKGNDKARIVRPLGHMEKLQSALHAIRQMCATVVTCQYAVPPSFTRSDSNISMGGAIKDTVFDAIAHALLEHPLLLVAQINESSAQPSWIHVDNINLDDHVTWVTVGKGEDYDARFQESTKWGLDTWFTDFETKPGWRITVLCQEEDSTHFDLIFSWNHAHIDGMGGKLFHESLLRHLDKTGSSDTSPPPTYLAGHPRVLEVPTKMNIPPPQEKLIKHPISPKYAGKTLWTELKPPFMAKKDSSNAYWCPIRDDTHISMYRYVTVGPETTKNLLAACRKNKTTITGLLHGLCLISLALQLDGKAESLASDTALDQRRFMPTKPASYPWYDPQKSACNLVTIMRHVFSPEVVSDIRSKCRSSESQIDNLAAVEDIVWSAATQTRQEMQERLDLGLKNDITGLMKFIKDWREQTRDTAKKARASSWAITNLGAMDGGDGEWKITRALFQIPAEQAAAAFGLSAVSLKGGDFNVLVNWQEGVLDDSMGDKLASDLQIWLEHIGRKTKVNGQV